MSIEYHFPIPFYKRQAEGSGLDALQEELWSACNLKDFSHREDWNKGTHRLSENAFGDCVLTRYNCVKFLKHLDFCIFNYVSCDPKPKYTITSSWFTKTLIGEHAHMHDHGGSDISGVYYLQTNGQDGNLYLNSPLGMLSRNFVMGGERMSISVQPKQGLLALWPSFIFHGVAENKTDSERISLSFNIKVE